ncbi:hypothetical protein [Floridanema evergladense]|uniref:Uncharacterized protein n=1 Tax=Floridaenema evergladense BLCC-F167 TaxID=3153639 RepID=A0ABV4WD05_9CYAN
MTLSPTEIQPHIQYQPVYEYQDLVDTIAALTKRVETLEKSSNESLKKDIEELRGYVYRWQIKQQRIEAHLRM